MTRIISALSGMGKSYAKNVLKDKLKIADVDGEYIFDYFWLDEYKETIINTIGKEVNQSYPEYVNPDYPNNYIQKIVDLYNLNEYDIIFIGNNYEVRERLHSMNIPYTVVLPKWEMENQYDRIFKEKFNGKCDYKWNYYNMIFTFEIPYTVITDKHLLDYIVEEFSLNMLES